MIPEQAVNVNLAPERQYALGQMLTGLAQRYGPDQAVAMVIEMNTAYGGYSEAQATADVHAVLASMNGSWPPQQDQAGPEPVTARPEIACGGGSGPETIRAVTYALNLGVIPDTYVADGQVAAVEEVSGAGDAGDRPLPAAVAALDPALLKSMLARHTYTFKYGRDKARHEFSPDSATLAAVLAPRGWKGLRPLRGITGSPVLRPDGTLLQSPGYDPATGVFLAPRIRLRPVPPRPSEAEVAWAKDILLGQVLRDFPWVSPADRANYLGMLVTQVIRPRLRGAPVPFFPITSTLAGSGKGLLVTIPGVLFGKASLSWTGDDEELRKTLTTAMRSQEGVINFDNILRGTTLRSAALAKLLTDRTWGDRLLGANVLAKFANDRLWTCTGNNIKVGGDIASRSVLISLDPRTPNPAQRSGFAVPDLESAIERHDWQRVILCALLVLVSGWAADGCPEASVVPMRQFTAWAQLAGGFLGWLGAEGFLANAGELENLDEDDADWSAFFSRWHTVLGTEPVTSAEVHQRALDPRWDGYFPGEGKGGTLLSVKSLGRRLGGELGNYHGGWVLRGRHDRTDSRVWWLERA